MIETEGAIKDRRASVRVPIAFELSLSDHYYKWDAQGCDLSPEGCGLVMKPTFGVGKELEVHFPAAWGAGPVDLSATVSHVTRGQVGLCLDVSKTEHYEIMLDRVDRLLHQQPALGVYAARMVRKLVPNSVLSVATALAAVNVSEPERQFLRHLSSGRPVGEVASALGADWAHMRHVPFALLQRGLIRLGTQSNPPPAPLGPAPVVRANVRPPQAEKYLQAAVSLLDSGDRKQAKINLQLASALSPNDLEIEGLLAKLDD